MAKPFPHQFVDRDTGMVRDEKVLGESWLRIAYSDFPLGTQGIARLTSGQWATRIAALAYFDRPATAQGLRAFGRKLEIDPSELTRPLDTYRSRRELFVRQIRYDDVRPMNEQAETVVSPADSKMIWGDLDKDSPIRVKERFFDRETLLGLPADARRYEGGSFGVFRIAPLDYHYFHAPVSGKVAACRELEGRFFSVNPAALSTIRQVLSSNRRIVILIDTDVEGGTGVGAVACVAIAAQVIGRLEIAYSTEGYESPGPAAPGTFIRRGQPLGIFHPGSSTVVTLFEAGRVEWCPDLAQHRNRSDTRTRYTAKIFGRNLTEVRVRVRDTVAYRSGAMPRDSIPLGGGRMLVRDEDGDASWRMRHV